MPSKGFIDFKVRVEQDLAGDFMMDLAVLLPYAQRIGDDIAIPSDRAAKMARALTAPQSVKALPPPAKSPPEPDFTLGDKRLSKQQRMILHAIAEGYHTREEIQESTGMRNVKRVINNLRNKYKLIRGNDSEGYALVKGSV